MSDGAGRPAERPFPTGKVLLCGLVLFANSLGLLMVFPLIPFMTKDFFPDLDKHSLGFQAGYLGSAYNVGAMFASLLWGRASDVYGRRPVLLSGIVGSVVCVVAFGTAQSFALVLLSRFMWGAMNGNIGVIKTSLSEICDHSHRARGFAIIGINGGLAAICGPALGGLLADPAQSWEAFDTPFWRKYKYLLPCLCVSFVGVLAWILAFFLLQETRDAAALRPLPCRRACRCSSARRGGYDAVKEDDGESVDGGSGSGSGSGSSSDDEPAGGGVAVAVRPSAAARDATGDKPPSAVMQVLRNRPVMVSAGLYGLGAFIGIWATEVFPLWLVNDPAHGGFSLELPDIAMLFLWCGPVQLAFQVFLYPRITKRLGMRRTSAAAAAVFVLDCLLLPFSSALAGSSAAVVRLAVAALFTVNMICRLVMLTCVFVLISNGSPAAVRGTAMGIGQTVCAFARILGPAIGANVFAWSENNGMAWPFNYALSFFIMAALGVVYVVVVRGLPESIEQSINEADEGARAQAAGEGSDEGGGEGCASPAAAQRVSSPASCGSGGRSRGSPGEIELVKQPGAQREVR